MSSQTPDNPSALPKPLPKEFEPGITGLSQRCSDSYERIVYHEQVLMGEGKDVLTLAPIRVLGHILRESLSKTGIEQTAWAIEACPVHRLDELGLYYTKYFIKIFYRNHGSTPNPAEHSSRLSFEEDRSHLVSFLMEPDNLNHSKARSLTLKRDEYRDVIVRDYANIDERPVARSYRKEFRREVAVLETAYIIPKYLANITATELENAQDDDVEAESFLIPDVSPESPRVPKRSTMWTMLQLFASDSDALRQDIYLELRGNRIHQASNVFTLRSHDHVQFDRLRLWFEVIDEGQRTYRVCVPGHLDDMQPLGPNGPVHEVDLPEIPADPENGFPGIPAPNPQYLALHAACCRIAHMSGAVGIFDLLHEDPDDSSGATDVTAMLDSVTNRLMFGTTGPRVLGRSEVH